MAVSDDVRRFVKKEVMLPFVYEIMEPNLAFTNIIPTQEIDGYAYTYRDNVYSASTDTLKREPLARAEGSEFPRVTVSKTTVKAGMLSQSGMSVEIDKSASVEDVARAVRSVGFWMAEDVNTQTVSALTDGATTPTWTPTATWDDATAVPVDDLLLFRQQMRREGYPYRMTDVYVNDTNRGELERYLLSLDIDYNKQRASFGVPDPFAIDVPGPNVTVHGLLSGLTEGYALGLDKNNPAGQFYYHTDSQFSAQKITYKTVINDKPTMKTADNIGLSTYTYMDDETHNQIVQFWVDYGVKVLEPYAVLYDSGI